MLSSGSRACHDESGWVILELLGREEERDVTPRLFTDQIGRDESR